jgi:hypothetical protein
MPPTYALQLHLVIRSGSPSPLVEAQRESFTKLNPFKPLTKLNHYVTAALD